MTREKTWSVECGSELAFPSVYKELMHEPVVSKRPLTTTDFGDEIPEIEELLAREIWDAIREKAHDESSSCPTFLT